jgi:hypothetical protein
MNLLEIEAGLINKSITLDSKDHRTNSVLSHLSQYIKEKTDWIKKLETGSYIGHDKEVWTKEQCDDMIKFLKLELERNYEIGKYVFGTEHYCFDCGLSLHLMIVDDKTISLIDYSTYKNKNEKNKMNVLEIPECPTKSYREAKKIMSEIDVPTGELLFTNYFNNDIYTMPDEYKSENSINCILGRVNLMNYLAEKNIGYGQMGNMSVTIFLNKTGDEIIIGSEYGYDDDNEYIIKHKGFKKIGNISLSVWRWMCGDLKVLKDHNEKYPDNLIINKQTEENYNDYVLTKVKSGRWVIEHYHDFCSRNDIIYSKLYLKK